MSSKELNLYYHIVLHRTDRPNLPHVSVKGSIIEKKTIICNSFYFLIFLKSLI